MYPLSIAGVDVYTNRSLIPQRTPFWLHRTLPSTYFLHCIFVCTSTVLTLMYFASYRSLVISCVFCVARTCNSHLVLVTKLRQSCFCQPSGHLGLVTLARTTPYLRLTWCTEKSKYDSVPQNETAANTYSKPVARAFRTVRMFHVRWRNH